MKAYKRLYVWTMNAKLFMSIYFVAVVFLTGIVIAVTGGNSIRLLTLVEVLAACAVIAVLQCVPLDETTDSTKGVFFGALGVFAATYIPLTVKFYKVFTEKEQ